MEITNGGSFCAVASVTASSLGLAAAYAPALLATGPAGFGFLAIVALGGGIAGVVMANSCSE